MPSLAALGARVLHLSGTPPLLTHGHQHGAQDLCNGQRGTLHQLKLGSQEVHTFE